MRWVSHSCRSLISSPFCFVLLAALGACPRPLPPTPLPPPPPPPPPIVVPEGCLENLAGEWTHAEDPSFHYAGEDDGGLLTLVLHREYPDAGGFRPRRFLRDGGAVPVSDAGADGGAADSGPGDAGDEAGADAGAPGTDAGSRDGGVDAGPGSAAGVRSASAEPLAPLTTPRIELTRTPRGFVGRTIAEVQHPSGRGCLASFATELVGCVDGGLLIRTRSAVALGDSCDAPASPGLVVTSQHLLIRPPPDAGVVDGGWRAAAKLSSEARDAGGARQMADAGARPGRAKDGGEPASRSDGGARQPRDGGALDGGSTRARRDAGDLTPPDGGRPPRAARDAGEVPAADAGRPRARRDAGAVSDRAPPDAGRPRARRDSGE